MRIQRSEKGMEVKRLVQSHTLIHGKVRKFSQTHDSLYPDSCLCITEYFFFPAACGIFLNQRSNLCPSEWKHGVLTTESEKESVCHLVMSDSLSLWTVAHHAPLSMKFSRQEYWSGLPFLFPWDLPHPGIEPRSPTLQVDSLLTEPPEKRPKCKWWRIKRSVKDFPGGSPFTAKKKKKKSR